MQMKGKLDYYNKKKYAWVLEIGNDFRFNRWNIVPLAIFMENQQKISSNYLKLISISCIEHGFIKFQLHESHIIILHRIKH
jgi:hypothetical protein